MSVDSLFDMVTILDCIAFIFYFVLFENKRIGCVLNKSVLYEKQTREKEID